MSRIVIAIALVVIVVVAVVGTYMILTYPKTVLTIPVSLTVGIGVVTKEFNVPVLDQWVQVQVSVTSGTPFWTATILNGDSVIWSHNALQGGQTTYNSGWISVPSGNYNFTFTTAGLGALQADATVNAKGGFW